MDILTKGQQKGLIEIDEANNSVYYIAPQIRRKWSNPEEQVQAAAYCMLVLQYGYPKEQISLYESVRIGSSNRQADIIVYGGKQQPLAVVECKSEVSDSEFGNAVEQAFSYAIAIGARYVWRLRGLKMNIMPYPHGRAPGWTLATFLATVRWVWQNINMFMMPIMPPTSKSLIT